MWGGIEDIFNFGGGVNLEGSSSLDSRAELSSEDNDGIIGCNGRRCILKVWANSPHIGVASCLQAWKSLRIREGKGVPRATQICFQGRVTGRVVCQSGVSDLGIC